MTFSPILARARSLTGAVIYSACVFCKTELNCNLSLHFIVAGSGLVVTAKLLPLLYVTLWDGCGTAVPSNGLVRNTRPTTEERCEVSEDMGQK